MRAASSLLLIILLSFFLFAASGVSVFCQEQQTNIHKIRGQVIDKELEEPLAFANIVIPGMALGGISDIDGYFEIVNDSPVRQLRFSHVGYFTQEINIEPDNEFIRVKLERKPIDLAVVNVYPGENPAHRIISNVKENSDVNNPETNGSFSYRSYNKIVFTENGLGDAKIQNKGASKIDENHSIGKDHHLLMVETVSDRFFASKAKDNEVVIASRISGFSEPYLAFLATRHQSFSFYGDYISLSGEEFLGPLSTGSTKRYLFILEDTSFDGIDSVFVVSYRPKRGTGFNGLEGILNINSSGWAIQSLTAEPAGKRGKTHSRIRQLYRRVDGKKWFPVQLDVDLEVFQMPLMPSFSIIGTGRTYLTNIDLEPDFSQYKFSAYSIDLTQKKTAPTDEFWESARNLPLTKKEEQTYRVLDSIGGRRNLDAFFRFAETMLLGKLRIGVVDFYIDEFIGYTRLDGVRLGAGFVTNHLFSNRLRLTGRFARGLTSKQWRTGYSTDFLLNKRSSLWLGFTFANKTRERGLSSFLEDINFFSLEKLRALFVPDLDLVKSHELWGQFNAFSKQLEVKIYGRKEERTSIDNIYPFPINGYLESREYNFFETGLMMRFVSGEKHVATPTRTFVEKKGSPVVFLTISRGIDGFLNGEYSYWRTESRIDHSYRIRLGGVQSWTVQAGLVDGEGVPWPKLFTTDTSPKGFWPGPPRAFATMDYNEFVSDKYLYFFFRHDFEKLLTGKAKFWPNISLISNFGIGSIRNENLDENANLKSISKGFFESGIAFTDLLGSGVSSVGLQLMYRYGPHARATFGENFSGRLFVTITF